MDGIREQFPDGTELEDWFYDSRVPKLEELGTPYYLKKSSEMGENGLYTQELQYLIDEAYANGGGVIVIPEGIYQTGALFFKQGVNLYVKEGGILKGSDNILDYPLLETRMEGESCLYYAALINADGLDGFTMCGPGTIDGNGRRSWESFWQRRRWNPKCTNKDEQRARLVYLSNCTNAVIADLHLQNSQFWTTHLYHCRYVKYLNCTIYSPAGPVKAPSTDAIDIDACTDILVKNCYMEVNDDAVALKGGKGPWADTAPENGSNERILIEDCTYGFCHGCLTCGSEAVHNRNIIVRRIRVLEGYNLVWLKMRPDTPQNYEYILLEEITGKVNNFININPWTQFYDLKGREDLLKSYASHVEMRNCRMECRTFFHVKAQPEQYELSDFLFEHLDISAVDPGNDTDAVLRMKQNEVRVTLRNKK